MATDQGADNAEEQAQQSAMPTEEQKGQEIADSQKSAQETGENFETPAGDSEEELSDSVKERTREQFDKLKARLRAAEEVLVKQSSSKVSDGELKPIYDPYTGVVDTKALDDLQRRVYNAERKAQEVETSFQQKSNDDQVRELYSAHPELRNPKTKEAKEFFDDAERIWMHSQAYPEKYGGEVLSHKQAADLAKKRMSEKSETQEKEAQNVESKEQASLAASGRPTQGVQSKVTSEEDLQRLRHGTRLGEKDSMISRMRAIREAQEAK